MIQQQKKKKKCHNHAIISQFNLQILIELKASKTPKILQILTKYMHHKENQKFKLAHNMKRISINTLQCYYISISVYIKSKQSI